MSAPRITIVIPTYNRAHFLREAIRSALAQTYQNFELVIADDGSTDNTPEVVSSFTDPRLRYYRHAINRGLNLNWQFAFSKATTEFIAPLADDDLYLPEHLATALEAIDRYPGTAYYTCPAEFFGRPRAKGFYRPAAITDTTTPLIYCPPKQAANFLGTDNPGPINNMVCRTAAIRSDLFWGKPDYLPNDLLIMTQLMAHGGFVFGNRVMTRFRVHETNTSLVQNKQAVLKYNCMAWYGVRWLAQFLLRRQLCTLADIEAHGLNATNLERHVVPLVLGLSSFDSPPELRAVARRVFEARRDADTVSARLRLARRLGFTILPIVEKVTQLRVGWRP